MDYRAHGDTDTMDPERKETEWERQTQRQETETDKLQESWCLCLVFYSVTSDKNFLVQLWQLWTATELSFEYVSFIGFNGLFTSLNGFDIL